jgi:hypothetical protein
MTQLSFGTLMFCTTTNAPRAFHFSTKAAVFFFAEESNGPEKKELPEF